MRAKNKHPAMKAECLFLPLGERHGQDEERTHEADRGGVRLIHIWQMTLTLIEFQEGVHFRRKGGAVVFGNAPPLLQMRYHKLQHIFYNCCCCIQPRATIAWSFT